MRKERFSEFARAQLTATVVDELGKHIGCDPETIFEQGSNGELRTGSSPHIRARWLSVRMLRDAGLTYKDIAAELNYTPGGVASALYSGEIVLHRSTEAMRDAKQGVVERTNHRFRTWPDY